MSNIQINDSRFLLGKRGEREGEEENSNGEEVSKK